MAEKKLQVDNTVQCTWVFGDTAGNTAHTCVTHATLPGATAVDVNLANALMTSLGNQMSVPAFAGLFRSVLGFNRVDLRDIRQTDLPIIQSTNPRIPFTGTLDGLPAQVALCLTVRTAKAGKRHRGRIYLGGFEEGASDTSGFLSAAGVAAVTSFAAGLIASYTAAGLTLGVTHRPLFDPDTGEITVPGYTTPATAVNLRNGVFDTQRGRILQQG